MNTCEHVQSASSDQSPLGKMLVTGFYDGPTDGFVECLRCGRAYAFRMLAWDEEQDVRVYGLAALDESLRSIRVEELRLPELDEPVTLVPPVGEQEQQAIERLAARPVQYVVAAVSLLRWVLAGKSVDSGDTSERDWFAWLGL